MKVFFSIILVLVFLVFASTANAHLAGPSLEKASGDYLVDIGYEPEEFIEGEDATFSFGLIDNTSEESVSFENIWVRITKGKETVFATGVWAQPIGETTMIFTFPEAGDYTLFTRYEGEDDTLAEATFNLKVQEKEEAPTKPQTLTTETGVITGIVLGAVITGAFFYFLSKRTAKSSKR